MLVTSKEMLQKAYEQHYAVAAINTQGGTYDIMGHLYGTQKHNLR